MRSAINEHRTFLSTLSLRRATSGSVISGSRYRHFYPRSPCGERPVKGKPLRGWLHFYPRSPCGERRLRQADIRNRLTISIHALLAESDFLLVKVLIKSHDFYPRSPCGERLWATCGPAGGRTFLSTLSLRRATYLTNYHFSGVTEFLSTLSLRRATQADGSTTIPYFNFYPRSPCGERRYLGARKSYYIRDFYPRSPCGERRHTSIPLQLTI